jgi:hypothetical protein
MRAIPHIAIPLLLGLVTTVASALALAAWMPLQMQPRHSNHSFIADGRPWSTSERYSRGMWHIWWDEINANFIMLPPPPEQFVRESILTLLGQPPEPPPHHPRTPEGWLALYRQEVQDSQDRRTYPIREVDHPPGWGTFARGGVPPEHIASGTDHGFGWPRPALWYRINGVSYFGVSARGRVLSRAAATDLDGGYLLRGSLQTRGYTFRALPYHIHWPGLITNTALFAILWFMLLFIPGAARRTLRQRRGRCLACGYDLRGLTADRCPECGGKAA